jgi:hypothetical protein
VTANAPESCATCKYFTPVADNQTQGECHRFPPIGHPIAMKNELTGAHEINTWGAWPPVLRTQSCGEFKLRLEALT